MQDGQKAVWSIPYVSVAFCPSLKQNSIAYRSSKVSDCIFEIHQGWQSGFSRVYSNSCCIYMDLAFINPQMLIGQNTPTTQTSEDRHEAGIWKCQAIRFNTEKNGIQAYCG